MKICRECGKEKPTTEFRRSWNKLKDGSRSPSPRSKCLDCEREASRKNTFLYTRGITHEERDRMLEEQGGKCAACGSDSPGSKIGWHVDHCHITKVIRGILCSHCNVALGHVRDSVEHLAKLTQYLFRHQQQGATTRA